MIEGMIEGNTSRDILDGWTIPSSDEDETIDEDDELQCDEDEDLALLRTSLLARLVLDGCDSLDESCTELDTDENELDDIDSVQKKQECSTATHSSTFSCSSDCERKETTEHREARVGVIVYTGPSNPNSKIDAGTRLPAIPDFYASNVRGASIPKQGKSGQPGQVERAEDQSVQRQSLASRRCRHRGLSVRFDHVVIRSYERVLVENPACSSGPSVGIGWEYIESSRLNVDDWERHRSRTRRRDLTQLKLGPSKRKQILLDWGYGDRDIVQVVRAISKSKFQRSRTCNNLEAQKVDELLEDVRRMMRSAIPRRSSISSKLK